MSLAVASRIARRELRGGLRGFRIFLACLILGVAAIAAVGSVRTSIEAGLAREGAVLLGGDAQVAGQCNGHAGTGSCAGQGGNAGFA